MPTKCLLGQKWKVKSKINNRKSRNASNALKIAERTVLVFTAILASYEWNSNSRILLEEQLPCNQKHLDIFSISIYLSLFQNEQFSQYINLNIRCIDSSLINGYLLVVYLALHSFLFWLCRLFNFTHELKLKQFLLLRLAAIEIHLIAAHILQNRKQI